MIRERGFAPACRQCTGRSFGSRVGFGFRL
jgi:hypothetical protein